jgi:biopolymer transport protein ExbD
MGMSVGGTGTVGKKINSEINTTPLVDVMLVLLIIFLITIPVAVTSINVKLPKTTNQPRTSKPENIIVSIDREGLIYWNDLRIPTTAAFLERLKLESVKVPQPELHIRGDGGVAYEAVGRVMFAAQRAGIGKVAFVIEPPPRN